MQLCFILLLLFIFYQLRKCLRYVLGGGRNGRSCTAVFCKNLAAIMHHRRLWIWIYPWISTENLWIWIWIWMRNFISTASLPVQSIMANVLKFALQNGVDEPMTGRCWTWQLSQTIVSDSVKAAMHLGANSMLSVVVCPARISNITGLASNASPSRVTPHAANVYSADISATTFLQSAKLCSTYLS